MLTFHRILSGCEAGSSEAWRHFLEEYSPVALALCQVYFPSSQKDGTAPWREAVGRLRDHDCEKLRTLDHQGEREFLVDLKLLLLQQLEVVHHGSEKEAGGTRLTLDSIQTLIKDLPLIHQQILLMKLAGYSDRTLEKILMIAPQVAIQALERLRPDYSSALNQLEDRCLWPAAWRAVLSGLRSSRTENCPNLRQFVRLLDGQATWYDKTPIETHMSQCLHCQDRWTSLREVVFWRREAPPVPAASLEKMLGELTIDPRGKRRVSLLKMLFG